MKNSIRSIFVLSLCALCGCPEGPPAGAGVPGAPVSDEQRAAVFAAVGSTLGGLRADEPEAARDALVAMFKADTAIEDAGISPDGGVWARFTDNRLLLVAMNNPTTVDENAQPPNIPQGRSRTPDRASIAHPQTKSPRIAPVKKSPRSASIFNSLPSSSDYFLFNTYYDEYAAVDRHMSNISSWFTLHGYTDQTLLGHGGTIENLMSVKNAGLVYLHGHGTTGFLRTSDDPASPLEQVFGLGTVTLRPDASVDAKYDSLLKSRQVGYLVTPSIFLDKIEDVLKFKAVATTGYFITRYFVDQQWTFAPGSWVYLDACSSSNDDFMQACRSKGAGLYLGWNLGVRHIDGIETAEYLFSRLLGINDLAGANFVTAEPVPQRAFPLETLLEDIQTRPRRSPQEVPGLSTTLDTSTSIFNLPDILSGGLTAHLVMDRDDKVRDPMLLPTIEQLKIQDQPGIIYDEPNVLSVFGTFGFDDPRVFVGDDEAEIFDGSSTLLVCRISATAHGPVIVQAGDHVSSPRMLTRWTGVASAFESVDMGPSSHLLLDVAFRGDVQSHRSKPGQTPVYDSIPDFDGTTGETRVSVATVTGAEPCPEGQTGAGYKWQLDGIGDPPVMRVGAEGDHIWFGKGGGGVEGNDKGEIEGSLAYGAHASMVVHETGDCTFAPPVDRMTDFEILGGVNFKIGPGNFDIDELHSEDYADLHVEYIVQVEAESTPGEDDPR